MRLVLLRRGEVVIPADAVRGIDYARLLEGIRPLYGGVHITRIEAEAEGES